MVIIIIIITDIEKGNVVTILSTAEFYSVDDTVMRSWLKPSLCSKAVMSYWRRGEPISVG